MLNRRAIVILFLLIAAIASLSLVSADDSADMLSNASFDEIGIDDNNDIIESEDCEDILEDTDDGTFTSLQNKIDNAEEGSNVSLKNDYCYNTNFGKTTGMEITKSITINGNGHVIDGLSKSGLFFIHDADNVVLNNMTFKNANNAFFLSGINSYSFVNCNFLDNLDDEGVAIFSASINSSSFINCNFTHNINGNGKGGAVQLVAVGNSSFVNCSFNKNSATGEGGAIYLNQVNNSLILNCSFVNNLAYEAGGAVSLTEVNTSSILDCNFTDDYACSNRAVLLTILTGEFSEDLIIGEDSYISLSASHGGAIMLTHTNSSLIEGCKFDRNIATGTGGSIHFYDVSHSQVSSSVFGNGFATYGGNIHCEYSTLLFKDLYMIYSHCISSGSGISSIDSDFTADNCIFYYLQCKNGAGAAIYTSKGNAHITNSYFVEGLSKYGGAIAVSQGNLTVLASSFKNNYGGQGGAIYSNHGNVYVADSFFNNSYALYGSSIFSMLSNSLVVKDNTFLNPAGYAIYSLCSKGVVESGNHFEKAYHVRLTYTGYANGKEFTVRSKVLNYVLSSNGTFLESYDFEEDNGDYSELVSMDLFDKDFPENRTLYGDRDSTFTVRFKFDKHYNVENSYYEHLYIELYDDSIIQGDQIEKLDETSNIEDSMRFSMNLTANNLLFEDNDLINFFLRDATPVSVINSSSSGFTGIPSSYDSRDYGYVTPVKDQGDGGNCWAFAGIATLETCIKKITGINYDFSENNPKNLMAMDSVTGWNFEINTGGYDSMIIGYLNSWMGPVRENLDTYDIYSSLSLICHHDFHVQDIVFLPPRKNNLDNDAYKKAIMDYGAFSVGFEWSSNNYHAVSIVGWNDNYKNYDSLGTYTKGAWIFKNSWSSDWGDEGYGYLSYSTPFLSDLYSDWHAYTFKFDDYDNYLKNYQYDYSGVTDYLSNYDGSIFYENKFVCNENPDFDELLISFSTYFICPTNYTVSLYINGYRVLTQDGYSEAGYYTIPFNKIFNIENGDEFRIRIENRNEGTNYAPVCMSDETTVTSILPNTSFVSFDGEKWFDLYDLKTYGEYEFTGTRIHTCQVACIKAFTCWYYAYVVDLDVNEFSSIDVNEKITLDFTLSGKYYYINTNELIEGTLITVKINDKYYYAKISDGKAHLELSFDEPGNYSFSSGYWNDLFSSNIVEFDFVVNGNAAVNKYDTILFANSVFKEYGGSAGTVVALVDNNGNLIRDEVITFTLNGVSTRFRTNSNGQVTIPIDLAPNIYFATISYGGNDIYSSSTVQIKIVVSKATPKLAVKKKTFKKAKKVKKYTVTLKDNVGKAMKNIKLTIKVNKKTYAARTNSKGKATFKIKKLIKKGKYAATVTFNGNAYYNKVTKKVKIVVK